MIIEVWLFLSGNNRPGKLGWKFITGDNNYTKDAIEWEFNIQIA